MNPTWKEQGFTSPAEHQAYLDHLDVRELEDTAANRATWFAARVFWDDRAEGDGGEDKAVTSDQTVSFSDMRLRELALSFATANADGLGAGSVVAKAEAYLAFLQTGKKAED